ncbi:MAG: TolC family protein, partial [Thermodesulfobacteriota bacterium]
ASVFALSTHGRPYHAKSLRLNYLDSAPLRYYLNKMDYFLKNYALSGFLRPAAFVLALCAFVLTTFSGADAAAPLTLDDVYLLSLKHHESVAIAKEAIDQSESSIKEAYAGVLPTVSTSAQYRRYSQKEVAGVFLIQPDDETDFELRVSQPLFRGGKDWSAIRSAKSFRKGLSTALEATNERVLIDTARAFYAILKAEKQVDITDASLKRAREQERVSKARLYAGTATRAVVLRADAEAAGIVAELINTKRMLMNAKERLRRFTGLAGPLTVVAPESFSSVSGTLPELIDIAVRDRRDYRIRKVDQELAKEGIKYARGSYLPTLTLDGVYTYRDQSPATTFLLNDSLRADLTLSYFIFEGGLRRAELSKAKSILREADLRTIGVRRDIAVHVTEAYNNVEALKSVMKSFRTQIFFARENYEMVFKQFTYGLADNVDLIDADTTLVSAELGFANATLDLQLAVLELKMSMGVLFNEVVGKRASKDKTD